MNIKENKKEKKWKGQIRKQRTVVSKLIKRALKQDKDVCIIAQYLYCNSFKSHITVTNSCLLWLLLVEM